MSTARTLLPALVVATALFGCKSAADERAEAERAQREADQKTARVLNDADKRVADIEQKAAEEMDSVKRQAAEKINDANDTVREKTQEADATLARARDDFRASTAKSLADRERDVAELSRKLEKKLPKAEAERVMTDLQSKSDAVKITLRDLEGTTAASLESVKKTIAQRVDELDRAIDNARKRV